VLDSATGSETKSKAFRALVSLVRKVQAFEEQLLRERDGVNVIIACADSSDLRLCEKVASFVRSLVHDGRLPAEDVARLAAVLAPLLRDTGIAEIQYRETLSSCVCELARAAPGACPPDLKAAAQERLAELSPAGEETEAVSLRECISLLPGA